MAEQAVLDFLEAEYPLADHDPDEDWSAYAARRKQVYAARAARVSHEQIWGKWPPKIYNPRRTSPEAAYLNVMLARDVSSPDFEEPIDDYMARLRAAEDVYSNPPEWVSYVTEESHAADAAARKRVDVELGAFPMYTPDEDFEAYWKMLEMRAKTRRTREKKRAAQIMANALRKFPRSVHDPEAVHLERLGVIRGNEETPSGGTRCGGLSGGSRCKKCGGLRLYSR